MVKRLGEAGTQYGTNDEVEFMGNVVQDLCEFTLEMLTGFIKKYPHRKEHQFVTNIIKNYAGNMLLRGCRPDHPLDFKELGEDFIEDFKDFMNVYFLDKCKTIGEMQ